MMKKPLFIFAALALACTVFAQSHPPISEMKVLFDPRTGENINVQLTQTQMTSYVSQIKRGSHLKKGRICESKTPSGQALGIKILSIGNGSFTRPKAKQQAVLYRYCDGNDDGPDYWSFGIYGFSIFEDGRLVNRFERRGSINAIYGVKDFNKNGLSELLISSCHCYEGGANMIEVFEFLDSNLFQLLEDDVSEGYNGYTRTSVLYVHPSYPRSIFKNTLPDTLFNQTVAEQTKEGNPPWRMLRTSYKATDFQSFRRD